VVELLTVGGGHAPASPRLDHTTVGRRLRYVGHEVTDAGLVVHQQTPDGSVQVQLQLRAHPGVAALRSTVTVVNGGSTPLVLQAVTSWSMSLGVPAGPRGDRGAGWELVSGRSDWLAENRWTRRRLRGDLLPDLAEELTGHDPRDAHTAASTGTWSTSGDLPVGVALSESFGLAWAWEVEHNGPWATEVGEDTGGWTHALSGPTERLAGWTRELAPGEGFTSVPVSVALGEGLDGAVGALTAHRRASRRPHPDNTGMPVVFNDYMNTLNGDPTTEKLLPLVDAAAAVGAEVFCIDAGWYDDSGHWWDSVGEWLPSSTRFPGGLGEVVDRIRAAGMVPGLWLEPEVVGVASPLAERLPDEAFLLRRGQRVVEHDRYHLDLRHPAARAHLDGVVDRLVADFGVGFFKLDYNIDPGAGTDHDSDSLGDGLLGHSRAVQGWLDGVLDRHPALVLESCSSGAMRADAAILARSAMQSSSDQQDPWKYPPIAASTPMSAVPEQIANWAYPQPGMTSEQVAFCLVTGLLGRFYLSGYLNRMAEPELALVHEAVEVAKTLRPRIRTSVPSWPTGLPGWTDPVVSLGLRTDEGCLVSIWRRDFEAAPVDLHLPHLTGAEVDVHVVFPVGLPSWDMSWDSSAGVLTVHAPEPGLGARVIDVVPRSS
jgi:alpha-galactosidase